MKFSSTDFFSKCDQVRRKLQIWSHLLKKSVMENFFFVHCFRKTLEKIPYFNYVVDRRANNSAFLRIQ